MDRLTGLKLPRDLVVSHRSIMTSTRDLIARHRELERDSTRIGVSFLRTDLDTALTFAARALQSLDDPETRHRNQRNARSDYDTVSRILSELSKKYVDQSELTEIQEKLGLLKAKLAELGDIVE